MNEDSGKQIFGETVAPRSPSGIGWVFRNERELRAGWRLAIYVVLTVAIVLICGWVVSLVHLLSRAYRMDAGAVLIQELILAAGGFGAAIILGKFEKRSFGVYGLPAGEAFRSRFWQGAVWGFVMISAIILLIHAFGGFSFGGFALNAGAILRHAALWGLVFLTVGFCEEFLFRGYAQFTLTTGIGFWPSALILSALFGMAHLANPGEGPVGGLSVFVIALFFCFTLERTGSLWFAVGLHAAFDWGETFFYAVPNSGIVMPGHLLESSLHGSRWLTGGSIGPEGSAMAFAVMGAAFVLFHFCYRRSKTCANFTMETGD